jgi:hypothetical protein
MLANVPKVIAAPYLGKMLIAPYNGWLLKFALERVFIFSVNLDTRKNERQMSVSTIET